MRKFSKPCLLAQSRGGLELYNWAIDHPQSVGCIAGIFPVADIAKYPGVKRASPAYHLKPSQLAASLARYNPIDRLEVLAKAHVPILHLHGDGDTLVPLADHSVVVKKRYDDLGGEMQLIVVPGQGHTLWPGYSLEPEFDRICYQTC